MNFKQQPTRRAIGGRGMKVWWKEGKFESKSRWNWISHPSSRARITGEIADFCTNLFIVHLKDPNIRLLSDWWREKRDDSHLNIFHKFQFHSSMFISSLRRESLWSRPRGTVECLQKLRIWRLKFFFCKHLWWFGAWKQSVKSKISNYLRNLKFASLSISWVKLLRHSRETNVIKFAKFVLLDSFSAIEFQQKKLNFEFNLKKGGSFVEHNSNLRILRVFVRRRLKI